MENPAEKIKKADAGDTDAAFEVANYIVWDDESRPIEPELLARAMEYYNRAIAADNAYAMLDVGAMYYVGRGVEQDFAKAIKWYTKAANRGSVTAMSNLGYCYYYGRSVPVDFERAYQMFSKAALLGDPAACYKMGDMLMGGKYIDKDPVSAFRCYMIAYDIVCDEKPLSYYPDVCSRLGSCCHRGNGTEVDLEAALEYLDEAKLYFKKRIDSGDTFTGGVYKNACEEWAEVSRELDSEKS